MKNKEIKIEDLPQELQDCIEDGEGEFLEEDGEWIEDGKYSFKTQIFKYEDKFYRRNLSKTGSYFTDWNFDNDDHVTEVTKHEKVVTIVEWKAVELETE